MSRRSLVAAAIPLAPFVAACTFITVLLSTFSDRLDYSEAFATAVQPPRLVFTAVRPALLAQSAPRVTGNAAASAGAAEIKSSSLLEELLQLADTIGTAELAAKVDADFANLTPEDLSTLQARLGLDEEAEKEAIKTVISCIQASMNSRMEKATKDLDELLQSSGDIEENIRDCLGKQDSPLPLVAVLQLNIAKAEEGGNEKMVQALNFVLQKINTELQLKLSKSQENGASPKSLLSKLLAMEEMSSRRDALRTYLQEGSTDSGLGQAIVQLVADVEEKYKEGEGEGEQRRASLELIRRVAIDAGVVIGETQGEEQQSEFTEQLTPLFEALSR